MSGRADVALCWMPYADLGNPSSALGLLKAELTRADIASKVVYCNHHLVERLGYGAFERIERSLQNSIMSWEILFAPYAGFQPRVAMRDMFELMRRELSEINRARGVADNSGGVIDELRACWAKLEKQVGPFLEEEADRVLAMNPKIVGCSVMTQQRNASLALLRAVKRRAPQIVTLLGGGICVGETAKELLRVAPQIDYVFSGEGDTVFGAGCRLILDGRYDELHERFPAFTRRGGKTDICITHDLDATAVPDYDDYFEQLESEDFGGEIAPQLPVEGSRGCWWGEKGRCNFCGLHFCPETLHYREKTPQRVWREIREQAKRYDCENILMTDCILSRDFIANLPDTARDEPRAQIFAECKSNLTEAEIERLARAGFVLLQPGIESLHDGPLKLMHKGNRAVRNVELLKFARAHGIRLVWNILMALPGDEARWYEDMISLMPRLYHLRPPSNVWPMILMRCSAYQEQAEHFGIHTITPQFIYNAMDPDDAAFTRKTAVFLYSPDIPVDTDLVRRMNEETIKWRGAFKAGARLTMTEEAGGLSVRDARIGGGEKTFALSGAEAAVCRAAWGVASLSALHARLDGEFGGEAVARAVDALDGDRLIARFGEDILALALPEAAYRKKA